MLFNTLRYAEFFAAVFVGSWALVRIAGVWPRLVFLLLVSYGFYAAWDWRYLPLIFASSTVDFLLARAIARETRPRARRAMLIATVALNLGFLGFFKYWNFAIENVAALRALLTGEPASVGHAFRVLLPPVGISFFTFESMSYVIDVYRGELPPHKSYLRYLLFVAFFPHLVAGPIVRPRDLLPQFERAPSLTPQQGGEGLFLIAIGLVKKVVLSDQLALNLVDRVFERPENYSALEVLAGVYGYAAQIYCDFSGYTDIAIGSALLLGVRFPKNFDAPYKARNLADFWRRWHISLSTWLRDYLYIPLGGNRGSELATYRNLMITMLLGGLWHGASWNFVFWGFLHGLGLAVTRAFQRAVQRRGGGRGERGEDREAAARPSPLRFPLHALGVLLTFHYVCLAWIFFRVPSFSQAVLILRQIGTLTTFHPNLPPVLVALLGVALASHYVPERLYERVRAGFIAAPAPVQGALLFLVAIGLHEAASAAAVPFVYFQF
ncbi:MBOAT family protein [Sorangium sp. So ce136]|uniref:MBOAT family O-acyltransferase n=1 Tax=Sorangium sp. So ce136 TaxID=3133284 RepID=UPI003F02B636